MASKVTSSDTSPPTEKEKSVYPNTGCWVKTANSGKVDMRKHVAEFEPADVDLFVPKDDAADPQLYIFIAPLNEELTIARFVDWCRQGLRKSNIRGDITIVDRYSER